MKIPTACSPSESQEGIVKTPYSALPLGALAVAVAWPTKARSNRQDPRAQMLMEHPGEDEGKAESQQKTSQRTFPSVSSGS